MRRDQFSHPNHIPVPYLSTLDYQSFLLHELVMTNPKSGVQQKRTKEQGRSNQVDYRRNQCRRGVASRPCSNKLSSSGRKQQLRPSPLGQPKLPFSNRLAQIHSPEPSKRRSLSRLRWRLVNKKT